MPPKACLCPRELTQKVHSALWLKVFVLARVEFPVAFPGGLKLKAGYSSHTTSVLKRLRGTVIKTRI